MTDVLSKQQRSAVMRAVRSRGNLSTELKIVAIFRAQAITGWRRHQPVPGSPDFVFPRQRLAVFVDGCFWHGCPRHLRLPATNTEYWNSKVERNRARDRRVDATLRRSGWTVLRIWEHALSEPERVAGCVRALLERQPKLVGKFKKKIRPVQHPRLKIPGKFGYPSTSVGRRN